MAAHSDIKKMSVGVDLSAQKAPSITIKAFGTKVPPTKEKGFTLIEIIMGMVVLAIVMTIITGLLAPQARQSADPIVQIRATELGQALMNEILAKSFDENSDRSPPWNRCGDTGALACTTIANPGFETGETRSNFDDVDDYNGLILNDSDFKNSLNQDVSAYYKGFTATISVVYDGDFDGTTDTDIKAKLITVSITASNNEVYGFSAYKGNY